MVERQFDLLKRDRVKMADDHPSSKPSPQSPVVREDGESAAAPQAATATSAPAEAQNPPEVRVNSKMVPHLRGDGT